MTHSDLIREMYTMSWRGENIRPLQVQIVAAYVRASMERAKASGRVLEARTAIERAIDLYHYSEVVRMSEVLPLIQH
jgi:hypothetical protein